MRESLPIDASIESIVGHVRRSRAVVVTAQPGAGKTTRVPPALVEDGPVILLQPRRVAARSIAQRIAYERGWTIGREVGWQVRFEHRFVADTRLLVVTEGVLTARFLRDALLSDFRTIVFDEFHERTVHVDVGMALARQAWHARDDLRIVVMSATLDVGAVSAFLGGCPVVDVPGRLFPLDIRYVPGRTVVEATAEALAGSSGDVLCFLPGASEIRKASAELNARMKDVALDVVPLHGSLESAAQDRALQPTSGRRRVVVATNIAETSVTVPGVTAVVDSGLHKVARYDAERAIDSLNLERITADAADQRAGRAGRMAPGSVWRLWDARDRLRPHREPEIHRVDLSAAVLDVAAWGGDPKRLDWFERPTDEALDSAVRLLERLGALRDGKLTELGDRIRRLPVHPRLASMLLAAGGARDMARACALLSERHFIPPRSASTASDLLSALDGWESAQPHVKRVAREIEDICRGGSLDPPGTLDETAFRRAVLAGYPDRVAQRRESKSPRVRLATGAGATIGPESGVREGEFLVAVDIQASLNAASAGVAQAFRPSSRAQSGVGQTFRPAGPGPAPTEARIRVASRIERDWLQPNVSEIVHRFDREAGAVRALRIERYDALVLAERPVEPDERIAVQLLVDAWIARGPQNDDEQLLRRLKFAGQSMDLEDLVRAAARGVASLGDVKLARALTADVARMLDRDAPESIALPSGRFARLDYAADGGVSASAKLQELFGLAETPRIGRQREPVLLALLAPNGRPVQLTRDLRSFWERTYAEVRKELRGRYPKHPWPDDPWKATPTARAKRR